MQPLPFAWFTDARILYYSVGTNEHYRSPITIQRVITFLLHALTSTYLHIKINCSIKISLPDISNIFKRIKTLFVTHDDKLVYWTRNEPNYISEMLLPPWNVITATSRASTIFLWFSLIQGHGQSNGYLCISVQLCLIFFITHALSYSMRNYSRE